MSRIHPRATVVRVALVAAAGMTALAGCDSSSPTAAGAAGSTAETTTAAVPATSTPTVDVDSVEGQTGAAAPDAEPGVVLTHASYDEESNSVLATAFLAGVVEEGGSCLLVVRQDDEQVDRTSAANPTATTTDCGNLTVALPDDADGEWEVAVSYSSATHDAASRTVTVELP